MPKNITVRKATKEDCQSILAIYQDTYGKDGIIAEGHDPYPSPTLFTLKGIQEKIASQDIDVFVVAYDTEIAAVEMIFLEHYYTLFDELAVKKSHRGLGLSSILIKYMLESRETQFLDIRKVIMVTHNLLSQAAHITNGLNKYVAFSFCQYPHVYFPDHPESGLTTIDIRGTILSVLTKRETPEQITPILTTLPEQQRTVAEELLKTRPIFVPAHYEELAHSILSQFHTCLTYTINTDSISYSQDTNERPIQYETEDRFNFFYLTLPVRYNFHAGEAELREVLDSAKRRAQHITVRFCGNTVDAIAIIQFLEGHGFVFHGLQPLAWYDETCMTFYDVFSMQWIGPAVLSENVFPGQTNAAIQIYGYPLGIPGKIIRFIEKQLLQREAEEQLILTPLQDSASIVASLDTSLGL